MLTKKMLEDAARCKVMECIRCTMKHDNGQDGCLAEVAQTALAYRAMMERLEYVTAGSLITCPVCGLSPALGHMKNCELAALLKEV